MKNDDSIRGDSNPSAEKSKVVNEIFDSWENLVSEIISYHSISLKIEHLRLPSFFMMNYLYRNGPQNLSTLASVSGVSKPSMTGMIDSLEGHGLVKRIADKEDRRRTAVDLTEKGHEKMNRMYFSKNEVKSELAEALGIRQLNDFLESLEMLGEVVRNVSEKKLNSLKEGDEDI